MRSLGAFFPPFASRNEPGEAVRVPLACPGGRHRQLPILGNGTSGSTIDLGNPRLAIRLYPSAILPRRLLGVTLQKPNLYPPLSGALKASPFLLAAARSRRVAREGSIEPLDWSARLPVRRHWRARDRATRTPGAPAGLLEAPGAENRVGGPAASRAKQEFARGSPLYLNKGLTPTGPVIPCKNGLASAAFAVVVVAG